MACVYECQQRDMQKQMLDAVYKRLGAQVPDSKQPTSIHGMVSFSIAIDTTKVPQLLDVSTIFKVIMGGAHPHDMISTIDLDSTTIKKILDCEEIFNQAHSMTLILIKQVRSKLPLWSFRSHTQEYLPLSSYQHGCNLTMNV